MQAEVLQGQLVYIDTEEGKIQILDKTDNGVTTLKIDADTKLQPINSWEDLIATTVDVVVIDGKTK